MSRLSNLIREYRKSESGGFALTFAISIMTIIFMTGATVDLNRATTAKNKLQTVCDLIVLAAQNDPTMDQSTLTAIANDWFDINEGQNKGATGSFPNGNFGYVWRAGDYSWFRDSAEDSATDVKVVLWGNVPTSFLSVFDKPYITVNVECTATGGAGVQPFELVIAMDTTGSMNTLGNWQSAIDAFTSMIEAMDESAAEGSMDESSVAFIPFNDRVNVGFTNADNWGNGPPATDGCLHPRENAEGAFDFMLDDDAPTGSNKFWKPTGWYCPDEISMPTRDLSDIANGMAGIVPAGTGRFDIGLAWAWRMLSPKWQGLWGLDGDYPTAYGEKKKIIVFFTDGKSIIYESEVHTSGTPTRPWGWNNGTPEGFEHFEQLCTNVKETGIELHMVYLTGNVHFKPYMERCATSEDHFHEVSNITSLNEALGNIAELTNSYRLTK